MTLHAFTKPAKIIAALLATSLIVASLVSTGTAQTKPMPEPQLDPPGATALQTAVFAGGCFWGVEAVFEHVQGVQSVRSGYAGGQANAAHYEMVSGGGTGHAESVQIRFDPTKVSYGQLLKVFFSTAHDPTQLNRQGPDTGTQYRSAIFFTSPDQHRIAAAYIAQLQAAHVYEKAIVTQLVPLKNFFPAESHHQDFARLNPGHPYIVYHDLPKVARLKRLWPTMYRDSWGPLRQ